MVDYIGRQFGDYKIIEEIGAGGMGQVFLAENVHHHKRYALKVLPKESSKDANFRRRFFDEARVMSELDHPNFVRVHHMGEHEGIYYLVMDYIAGPEGKPWSLHDELKEVPDGRIEPQKTHKWVTQIAEGLAHAHKRGVIHRDIKPGNCLIAADGDIKIADFGLAKAIGSEFILSQIHTSIQQSLSLGDQRTIVDKERQRQLGADSLDIADTIEATPTPRRRSTGSTGILGTYDYMSPEQREGGVVDERSDIYSLGIMIYRMLTGRRPVGRKSVTDIVSTLSEKWDGVIDKCIEHEPEERYGSVNELLGDLKSSDKTTDKVGAGGKKIYLAAAVCIVVAAVVLLVGRTKNVTTDEVIKTPLPTARTDQGEIEKQKNLERERQAKLEAGRKLKQQQAERERREQLEKEHQTRLEVEQKFKAQQAEIVHLQQLEKERLAKDQAEQKRKAKKAIEQTVAEEEFAFVSLPVGYIYSDRPHERDMDVDKWQIDSISLTQFPKVQEMIKDSSEGNWKEIVWTFKIKSGKHRISCLGRWTYFTIKYNQTKNFGSRDFENWNK